MRHIEFIKKNQETIEELFKKEAEGAFPGRKAELENIIKYLQNTTFFIDPASAKYHNAFDGGLAHHCLQVYLMLVKFNDMRKNPYPNAVLLKVAFLHDLCKIGNYTREMRWRKDENNKWESYYNYGYADLPLNLGHGAESLIKAQEVCSLTKEEAAAIFWHMGVGTTYNIYEFYNQARRSALVTMLHMADVYSSTQIENYGFDDSLVFRDVVKLVYGT
jgi:hypothetical protein